MLGPWRKEPTPVQELGDTGPRVTQESQPFWAFICSCKMIQGHQTPCSSKIYGCPLRFSQFGKGWIEAGIGFQRFEAWLLLMLSPSWKTAASMLMTDRQPSAWVPPPWGHPEPGQYRTATCLKSWSMQLPPKDTSYFHSFFWQIFITYLQGARYCDIQLPLNGGNTVPGNSEQNKNCTCPYVAYSQSGELDIKIPLF